MAVLIGAALLAEARLTGRMPRARARAISSGVKSPSGPMRMVQPAGVAVAVAVTVPRSASLPGPSQRLFESACGACHHDGDGPEVQGLNQPLALNINLHSARPDNLVRTVLDGIWQPAFPAIGHMPAFRHALDDAQVVELAGWMRQHFAPGQPPWADLPATVARLRGPAP